MVNADSGQAVHSSERSDGGSGSCDRELLQRFGFKRCVEDPACGRVGSPDLWPRSLRTPAGALVRLHVAPAASRSLRSAMLGQEPQYILSPRAAPLPREAVALSWRVAKLGVDLHVGILANV